MGILMEAPEVNVGTGGYRSTEVFAMSGPREFYADHGTFAVSGRDAQYEKADLVPISLKSYKHCNSSQINYLQPQQVVFGAAPRVPLAFEVIKPTTSNIKTSHISSVPVKEDKVQPPPKKKWIREYLEEPKSPIPVRALNLPAATSSPPQPAPASAITFEYTHIEHSRPRTNHGLFFQVPSPPSACSSVSNGSSSGSVTGSLNGSINGCINGAINGTINGAIHGTNGFINGTNGVINGTNGVINGGINGLTNGVSSNSNGSPRAPAREVHNKLEKNRRAHLKECFELLKKQLPSTPDDKKISNLSILASAIRHIQVLRRKERECEHEMERLAREKIAAQQRLAALKRDVSSVATKPRNLELMNEEKNKEDRLNGQVLAIPISITSSPPRPRSEATPPQSLNLCTKLRTLPIQITPSTSQLNVVRTSYGARHNTLTLTTLAPAPEPISVAPKLDPDVNMSGLSMNGMNGMTGMNGVTGMNGMNGMNGVCGVGVPLVVGGVQLLAPHALRLLHAPGINGVTASDHNRLTRENGIITSTPCSDSNNVVVSGLTPLVVSQSSGHLLHSHTLTHKMVETQIVKGSVTPLTVSAQYLSATTIVKPVVVVSSAATPATRDPS